MSKTLYADGDSELVAVLRYSNHADPLYCHCGITWGRHGLVNGPPSSEFRYDFTNPANAVIRLRGGYSLIPGPRLVMPNG